MKRWYYIFNALDGAYGEAIQLHVMRECFTRGLEWAVTKTS